MTDRTLALLRDLVAIEGGHELSTYSARTRLQFERRPWPGEALRTAFREVGRILDDRDAYLIDPASRLPALTMDAARSAGCTPVRSTTFWIDTGVLGAAGIPTVIFGPGGEGLHGLEEYVIAADVLRCRDSVAALARRFTAAA